VRCVVVHLAVGLHFIRVLALNDTLAAIAVGDEHNPQLTLFGALQSLKRIERLTQNRYFGYQPRLHTLGASAWLCSQGILDSLC
jgi:hypothetical protein